MARIVRKNIVRPAGGFFHVLNRINGLPGWYPLQKPFIRQEFVRRLRHAVIASCIQCAGFVLMGNHFHLVLFVEEFRRLSRSRLEEYARARWGRLWKLRTSLWTDERWERFNRDLFDLSVFMRDFQSSLTTWFNGVTGHQGRLWRDRFKSLALGDLTAVRENLLYVELNPVRAHLTDLPAEWEAGSAYLRKMGQDDFLTPLERLFPEREKRQVVPFYRTLLLHRGVNPTRENQASIPAEILRKEMQRGLAPGIYRKRHRGFIDGLMLGSEEDMRQELERMVEAGVFQRRKNPRPLVEGTLYMIREQRSHARC